MQKRLFIFSFIGPSFKLLLILKVLIYLIGKGK